MTAIKIGKDILELQIEGFDKLWSLRSNLQIPIKHIISVESAVAESKKWIFGLRLVGTYIPGVISAGTFYQQGGFVFWDVHNVKNAIGIELRDERYKRLIIEVTNPLQVCEKIKKVINHNN